MYLCMFTLDCSDHVYVVVPFRMVWSPYVGIAAPHSFIPAVHPVQKTSSAQLTPRLWILISTILSWPLFCPQLVFNSCHQVRPIIKCELKKNLFWFCNHSPSSFTSLLAPPTILQDGTVPLEQAPPLGESVPFYPVAPGPPQPNFAAPFQPEMHEQYMPMPPQQIQQQIPTQISQQMPPQFPRYSPREMPSQMPPQTPPGMPPQMPPPMPGAEHGSSPFSPQQFPHSSPTFTAPPPQGKDFYDEMARMVS